jgi:hypothetical protein
MARRVCDTFFCFLITVKRKGLPKAQVPISSNTTDIHTWFSCAGGTATTKYQNATGDFVWDVELHCHVVIFEKTGNG